jgi:hypothetical protein
MRLKRSIKSRAVPLSSAIRILSNAIKIFPKLPAGAEVGSGREFYPETLQFLRDVLVTRAGIAASPVQLPKALYYLPLART